MKHLVLPIAAAAAAALMSTSAMAGGDPLYFSNPVQFPIFGDCSFSTVCAADVGRGDDYAAQEFTVGAGGVVLTSADFQEVDLGTTPTAVNWGFIQADGAGGLPGTILAAGTDNLVNTPEGTASGYDLDKESWSLGTVALGPGTYYLAIQAISPSFYTYLLEGVLPGGAAETHDGGVTWGFAYEGIPSVAVDLFSAGIPEPATWAMMLLGVGMTGSLLRRRRQAAVTA